MYKHCLTYRVTALLLATLMLCVSIGMHVDMHYCQGKLKSFSLFGQAKSCHGIAAKKTECSGKCSKKVSTCQASKNVCKKNCCSNELISVNLGIEYTFSVIKGDWTHSNKQHISKFLFPHKNLFFSCIAATRIFQYFNYKPPLLSKDICILVQSFLC